MLTTRNESERANEFALREQAGQGKRLGLILLLSGYVVVAVLYATLIPLLEGFDAEAHFRAVMYFRTERSLPNLDDATVQVSYELVTQPPLYPMLAALPALLWPVDPALAYARESRNPYFTKVLGKRQTVSLPNARWEAVAPIWSVRGVSLLGGLCAVLATWVLANAFFPHRRWLALAAGSLVAFNPQFLFMSVTVTNDAWAVGTIGMTVALAARAVATKRGPRSWGWIGLWAGLAIVTKYSGFLVAVPAGILWGTYVYRMGWKRGWYAIGWTVLALFAVAGWWYMRIIWLYGEAVPLNQMARVLPTLRRAQPFSVEQTLEYVPWLVASFWGVFVANIAPALYLETTRYFMVVGTAGALVALLRGRDEKVLSALAVTSVWIIVVSLSVLYWTRTIDYGEQGRLAHIAAPAFGLMWAVGWGGWFPRSWQSGALVVLVGAAVAVAFSQAVTLGRAYDIPDEVGLVTAPDRPIMASYEEGMGVVGVDFPTGAMLTPQSAMPLEIFFRAEREIEGFYTLFLHLADEQDRLLWQFDGVPASGRHATRQWKPGQVFEDRYEVAIDRVKDDGVAWLSMGFYPYQAPRDRLQAFGQTGEMLGDRLTLGKIRLQQDFQPVAPEQNAALAIWENGIELVGLDLERTEVGAPVMLEVTWLSAQTLHQDYTVFVQLLDEADQVMTQVDVQPQNGRFPTSTWRSGAVIEDAYRLETHPDTAHAGWSRLIIGFYDGDGRRLLLEDAEGALDAYVIERNVK